MFTIKTDSTNWIVTAEWYGAERVVCRGTIWECITFVYNHKEA